jgi:hypothetical protein
MVYEFNKGIGRFDRIVDVFENGYKYNPSSVDNSRREKRGNGGYVELYYSESTNGISNSGETVRDSAECEQIIAFSKKCCTFEGTLILEATVKKCSLWQ